jgi:predicted ferric reductase
MDMPGMDMGESDIGDTPTANGVPGYFYMQRVFWTIIGSFIALAVLINILSKMLAFHRLRSSSAKPRSLLWIAYATATAIFREITYVSLGSITIGTRKLRLPTLGNAIVILSYFIVVIVMSFYKYDTEDQWSWEPIAYRAGCIAQAQLPLVYLLAGKQNVIGLVTGVGYERLSWIHRWISRIVWLTVTLHMSFWFRSWARYDYIRIKLTTDSMTQTGFAAWVMLTFMVVVTVAPIRRWNYEIFVISHIVLIAGLTYTIYIHVDEGKNYIWTCVAIWALDRFLRTSRTIYLNLGIFQLGKSQRIWANRATLTPMPGNITRITIDVPASSWKAGQHMFLSCHGVLPLQSHPFTIASLPTDNKMEFLVQTRGNGTKKIHKYASKYQLLPSSEDEISRRKNVAIEGPYGRIRSLRQFDSVLFFAGSTGATFTTPLMRDIVRRWDSNDNFVTKRIRFVWAIKSKGHLVWFREQLEQVMEGAAENKRLDLEVDISVYVTCDGELKSGSSSAEKDCLPSGSLHGDAAEISTRPSSLTTDEKKDPTANQIVRVPSISSGSIGSKIDCGPNGTCCCKSTIVDEDTSEVICSCGKPATSSSSSSSLKKSSSPLKILTGRPYPRSIIRKVLEEAEGESAVVVCGPRGLQDDVRDSVVALSDERAVHKGTGAQGVYLHVEGFCY